MSDVMDDLVVSYPKTVTACHAEINRLERLLAITSKNFEMRDAQVVKLQDRVDELEEEAKAAEVSASDAIHAFLDELDRTGPMRFDVPQTARVNSAIVALHDCVGRRP